MWKNDEEKKRVREGRKDSELQVKIRTRTKEE